MTTFMNIPPPLYETFEERSKRANYFRELGDKNTAAFVQDTPLLDVHTGPQSLLWSFLLRGTFNMWQWSEAYHLHDGDFKTEDMGVPVFDY